MDITSDSSYVIHGTVDNKTEVDPIELLDAINKGQEIDLDYVIINGDLNINSRKNIANNIKIQNSENSWRYIIQMVCF